MNVTPTGLVVALIAGATLRISKLVSVAVLAAVAGALIVGVERTASGQHQPSNRMESAAVASGTPIVDPVPTATPLPVPIYLPNASQRYDSMAPGPLPASAEGFVVELQTEWRQQCTPATHALIDKPEGTAGAKATSLLYRSSEAPDINLDLYIGDYVKASGLLMMAPERCKELSWQVIEVREIEIREIPPGS